jgi:hypothetical protein
VFRAGQERRFLVIGYGADNPGPDEEKTSSCPDPEGKERLRLASKKENEHAGGTKMGTIKHTSGGLTRLYMAFIHRHYLGIHCRGDKALNPEISKPLFSERKRIRRRGKK